MCKIFVEKYKMLSDNELISLIRENNQDAFEFLFDKYLPLIKSIIQKNKHIRNDYDDMLQDATISFYYCVHMYDFRSSSFSTFLSLCIDRSLKSTIRKANAKKRIPEELIVPINHDFEIEIPTSSAEEEFFDKENGEKLFEEFKSQLSDLEFRVLKTFLETQSYEITAKALNLSRKSVDNAMLRIRRKISS